MKYLAVAAVAILAGAMPVTAQTEEKAQNGATTLDPVFYDHTGTSALAVMIHEGGRDDPLKVAGIGVKFQHLDDHYRFDGTYRELVVTFSTADDWQKFVSLWKKAKAAHGDTHAGNIFDHAGDYFDGDTELRLGNYSDGGIDFTMAGNGHNSNNVPNDLYTFNLERKDFKAFDRTVKKVSAYFRK